MRSKFMLKVAAYANPYLSIGFSSDNHNHVIRFRVNNRDREGKTNLLCRALNPSRGARAPPEKSQCTLLVFILGQFFGKIPQIFGEGRYVKR